MFLFLAGASPFVLVGSGFGLNRGLLKGLRVLGSEVSGLAAVIFAAGGFGAVLI